MEAYGALARALDEQQDARLVTDEIAQHGFARDRSCARPGVRDVLEAPDELMPGAEWVVEMHAMGQTWASRTRVDEVDRSARTITYRSGTDDGNPSFTRWQWTVDDHEAGCEVRVSWDLHPETFWRRHLIVHLRRPALAREVPTSLQELAEAAERPASSR